jgi:hypothetical protein
MFFTGKKSTTEDTEIKKNIFYLTLIDILLCGTPVFLCVLCGFLLLRSAADLDV